jgi:predicted MFS family arabinose efflux permease
MMFGSMAGGLIAEAFGVQVMMLLLSGVTFIGFLMFVISNRKAARGVEQSAPY